MVSYKSLTRIVSKLDTLNNWIKLFCILLVVAYVLSLGASFLWISDLFRHFMVQYALLAAFFALLALIRKLWPYALAMVALSGLCGYEIISRIDYVPPPASAEALSGPGVLKVITYNRHTSLITHQEMVDFIKAENPDIFFILEANDTHAKAVKNDLRELYPYTLAFPKDDAFGMVAASKHPWKQKWKTFSQTKIKGVDNFLLIARIQPEGQKPVSFYALHAPPPLTPGRFAQRNAELDHAATFINSKHRDAGDNVILLGDWNITPYSPFFAKLLESGGFKNQTTSRFFLPTWPAQYYSLFQIPIDHMLHRGRMTLIEKRLGPSLGSDHHAVVAIYRLEPDAPETP